MGSEERRKVCIGNLGDKLHAKWVPNNVKNVDYEGEATHV